MYFMDYLLLGILHETTYYQLSNEFFFSNFWHLVLALYIILPEDATDVSKIERFYIKEYNEWSSKHVSKLDYDWQR